MLELISLRTYSGSNFVSFRILCRKKEETVLEVVSTRPAGICTVLLSPCLCGEAEGVRSVAADLRSTSKECRVETIAKGEEWVREALLAISVLW